MPKGGRRYPNPGGRPKGSAEAHTLQQREELRAWRQGIWKRLNVITERQVALATGLHIIIAKTESGWEQVKDEKVIRLLLETDPGGETWRITTKEPDGPSLKNILDRALGTATETLEVTGEDGGPVVTTVIHKHVK